jgi:hypothetical protein
VNDDHQSCDAEESLVIRVCFVIAGCNPSEVF